MKLVVNGKESKFNTELTVSESLVEQNVKMPETVSVELNGQILKGLNSKVPRWMKAIR